MERLFVDTGAWFAYVNRKDKHHLAVRRAIVEHAGRLVTSNFVFDETISLCRYRLGHAAAVTVGNVLLDPESVDLLRVMPEDENYAWSLFGARPEQHYSFTDCTSFALMRRLGMATAIAIDRDFFGEGFIVLPALTD